ncbi:MAG: hypothetical protein DSY34_02140 [Desulfurobacterium sp.]|nr:MAG: hypothetical protein DSY34_02140 [Desulfurobacterium sp.]
MKRVVVVVVALLSMPVSSMAGAALQVCTGCHFPGNNMKAPTIEELKKKCKTPQALVKKALESNNPMMAAFKNNVQALKDAAKEIYGK